MLPLLSRLMALSLTLLPVSMAHAADDSEVPYWASLRASVINMRVGPGEDYRINWVYRRQHLPVKVLRTMEGWRLVEDPDGARGWMIARFLSRERSGYVTARPSTEMHVDADADSRILWRLATGVVGKLGNCGSGWCKFEVDGRKGYVREDQIWGVDAP